ncbi:MAG: YihA family ribosome biogenesis GTP-binding protein [Duodenibacillus sp.]|nr:YihA family ribosome biogenesis GTP-binding protein [Duodenibacillus sp.]
MSLFDSATFYTSAAKPSQFPGAGLPEIAFAGRSNAGKSTAINVLTRQGRLAFASKTPGRTQLVNFFRLSQKRPGGQGWDEVAYLVDLPGYGYAKAAEATRSTWAGLIGGYLADRPSLTGVVILMDARRPFMPADEWLIGFFAERAHVRQLWLINKCDQIKRGERALVMREAARRAAEAGPHVAFQLFSGLKKEGVAELQKTLLAWIDPEGRLAPPPPAQA